jgi:hypothetical protein
MGRCAGAVPLFLLLFLYRPQRQSLKLKAGLQKTAKSGLQLGVLSPDSRSISRISKTIPFNKNLQAP